MTKPSANAPSLFKHDGCADCVYLGPYGDREDQPEYDLWFCPQQGVRTVIARWSDEPEDYMSGWESSLRPLAEARRRATERRLTDV